MKLALVAASLSLSSLLVGCATSVDPGGSGGTFDSGSVATDAVDDVSAKDTALPPKDTALPPKDSDTRIDSGATGDDTGASDDTDPGVDSDVPDSASTTDTAPPDATIGGVCSVDTDCSAPLNCCDKSTKKCGIWFIKGVVCLPF